MQGRKNVIMTTHPCPRLRKVVHSTLNTAGTRKAQRIAVMDQTNNVPGFTSCTPLLLVGAILGGFRRMVALFENLAINQNNG